GAETEFRHLQAGAAQSTNLHGGSPRETKSTAIVGATPWFRRLRLRAKRSEPRTQRTRGVSGRRLLREDAACTARRANPDHGYSTPAAFASRTRRSTASSSCWPRTPR